MENNTPNSPHSIAVKIRTGVLLFLYFGFIAIPELTRPYFSMQLVLWVLALPIILIALVVTGIRGGIGLWREKVHKAIPNSQNKYFVWLASLSILWLLISIAVAKTTYFSYSHKKFDRDTWNNASRYDGGMFQISMRERMLEDLTTNVIPGRSKADIIHLLGEPDRTSEYDENEDVDYFVYYYKMGMVDPVCLVIIFDDKGFVKDHFTSECG